MRERDGRSIAMPIEGRTAEVLHREIVKHVAPGSTVYTVGVVPSPTGRQPWH